VTQRVMIHAPHPDMPTGYASQVREIAPRLAKAGYDVALSCTAGVVRMNTTWRGLHVYGRGSYTDMAEDLIGHHYKDFGADLVITLCCPWKLHGQVWRDLRTIHLMPVDGSPLGHQDYDLLMEGGGMPGAISRFGERELRARDFDPLYLPHAIDTSLWKPPRDRRVHRRAQGIDHMFVVGMNGANTDPDDRKAFFESFGGFAKFHAKHPKSLLTVHAMPVVPDGLNLLAVAQHWGILENVIFTDMYQLASTGAPQDALMAWYGALDVLLMPSKGEGYGVPLAEAQACGTPVVTMGWSTGPELVGPGWMVEGKPSWHGGLAAAWHTPSIDSIADKLCEAFEQNAAQAAARRSAARKFAVNNLDYDTLWAEHWVPVLDKL
jgi:glycosyltransferase involved in cell wall biosynthesis